MTSARSVADLAATVREGLHVGPLPDDAGDREALDRAHDALAELAASATQAEAATFREPGIGEVDQRVPRHAADATIAKCIGALQGLAEGNSKWEAILTKHAIPVNEATEALHQVFAEREVAEAEAARLREERDAARSALEAVRRECSLPEHIAEIVGGALPTFDDAVRGIEARGRDAV